MPDDTVLKSGADEPQKSKLKKLLGYAVKNGASDLHICVGSPPAVRIDGEIRFLPADPLTLEDMESFVNEMMNERQRDTFYDRGDFDLAHGVPGLGRFRVNDLLRELRAARTDPGP